MFCYQNHVVEVAPAGNKKWMKNKKKAGKKSKKKGGGGPPAKGAPVKKTSTANSITSTTAASTSSLASSSADVVDRKDHKDAKHHSSPVRGYHRLVVSGLGTGGSGGSMNWGVRVVGPPSSGATEKFRTRLLGKSLRLLPLDDGF